MDLTLRITVFKAMRQCSFNSDGVLSARFQGEY